MHTPAPAASSSRPGYLFILSLTALGVVYGDIGTSPLYAIRECFFGPHAVTAAPANILGVLSLIFWALILVISVKYLVFILKADNQGEGGILALTALVAPEKVEVRGQRRLLIYLGLFGAALLYGDGMITPAISVLSAVEGLEIVTPVFAPYVIPLTVVILVALFLCQYRGTSGVGVIFGPITLLWFVVLALLGITHIVQQPVVLNAINPYYALVFFLENGWLGFLVLGSVFLVVTGGEALYADMGHFGARPIRLAWFAIVLPSLLLNYFGQGALLLVRPEAVANPFYLMAPSWALIPLVILSTAATVIASQAVISGAFSLSMQAVQLGYSPRLNIEHTSAHERGQIYLPAINWLLMVCCIGLVLGFRTSSNLAAAYGIAVTTTMVITTLLFFFLARDHWCWKLPLAALLCGGFLLFDLAFFGANIAKIASGGWFPLVLAAMIFTLMSTWKTGRRILYRRLQGGSLPVKDFCALMESSPPSRVPGTAVFMSGNPRMIPSALLHNLKHNKVLHERVIFLSVLTAKTPYVSAEKRLELQTVGTQMYLIFLHYGFMESPNVPEALQTLELDGWVFNVMEATFFLGRETILPSSKPGMALWREKLFMLMSRNSRAATDFFGLPPNRVIELGMQVEI